MQHYESRSFSNDDEMIEYCRQMKMQSFQDASVIVGELKKLQQHRMLKLRKELIKLDRILAKQKNVEDCRPYMDRMKSIGVEIHDEGGMSLLRTIWHSIPGFNSVVECAWNGIGTWVY